MDSGTMQRILLYQKNEITESIVYGLMAGRAKGKNREVLTKISKDEMTHYNYFKKITGTDTKPDRLRIFIYTVTAALFGMTFSVKMMENGEVKAEHNYENAEDSLPGIRKIINDEVKHEEALVKQLEEDAVEHMGSMILAVNNSIQEITGIVVGLTFALANSIMVGKTALVSGVAATLAMAASEYLSQKTDIGDKKALKAAIYAGTVYIFVTAAIVTPFFLVANHLAALSYSLCAVAVILTAFTFYMSVVKNTDYKKAFLEVSGITAVVIGMSLAVGMLIKHIFGN
ncbi:MAG: rubrerythrin family protein [Candidatus Goldiibacteriota bacterium HGW-Goldbacteria-1]|nr:MAG: rubrerythrin family protein [Candidatus Goldiibacteriota bacterium HGW-Goldbacteria-1]